jgi:hypothetical protein
MLLCRAGTQLFKAARQARLTTTVPLGIAASPRFASPLPARGQQLVPVRRMADQAAPAAAATEAPPAVALADNPLLAVGGDDRGRGCGARCTPRAGPCGPGRDGPIPGSTLAARCSRAPGPPSSTPHGGPCPAGEPYALTMPSSHPGALHCSFTPQDSTLPLFDKVRPRTKHVLRGPG